MPFLLGAFTSGLFSGMRNAQDIMVTADAMRKQHLSDKLAEKASGQIMSGMQGDSSTTQVPSAQPTAVDTGDTGIGLTAGSGAAATAPITSEPLPPLKSTTPASIFRPAPVAPPKLVPGMPLRANAGTGGEIAPQQAASTVPAYLPTAGRSDVNPPPVAPTRTAAPAALQLGISPIAPIDGRFPDINGNFGLQPIDGRFPAINGSFALPPLGTEN